MTDKNIVDLTDAKEKKRQKEGWTQKEIEEIGLKELLEYQKIAKEHEPENLASGDPLKMYDEDKDDDKKN